MMISHSKIEVDGLGVVVILLLLLLISNVIILGLNLPQSDPKWEYKKIEVEKVLKMKHSKWELMSCYGQSCVFKRRTR